MAIKFIRCSKRDKNPPIAYRGKIHPEALEQPAASCPMLVFLDLVLNKKGRGNLRKEIKQKQD